jgi:CMP-N-acetylneuraminic acid synthetase
MNTQPVIAAVIPMRHDSQRVPAKNWRTLGGRPLFLHIVEALSNCQQISQIVIDTDSDVICSIAARECPHVKVLERPAHLRDDRLPMNDVLLNTISQVPADLYLQTHSTNPLLSTASISNAIKSLTSSRGMYDSLFAVSRLQQRLWDALARPVNHNAAILLRTQDLPPIYAENSCMYLFSEQTLRNCHNRVGARPLMFELDRVEAWDIDEELDFTIAEMLYQATKSSRSAA